MKLIYSAVLFAALYVVEATLSIDSPACTTFDQDNPITDPSKCKKGEQLSAPACDMDQERISQALCTPGNGQCCYTLNDAFFGYPPYGGDITGQLYYKYLKAENRDGCDPIANIPNQDEEGKGAILVLDRGGGCSFVQKVRNAEVAGATAVIIVDNQDTNKRVFMKDDGTGGDVSIPSGFVNKKQGDVIKAGIETYDDAFVRATLRWTLPESDGVVKWSLWTSADDDEARSFKKNFQLVFDRLGAENQEFTPHFYVIDGEQAGCIKTMGTPPNDKRVNLCGKQCIYDGLYCAEDPERDLQHGIDGQDVVYENLRQMCIYDQSKTLKQGGQVKFFDYLDFFASKCRDKDETHSRECSEKQMLAAKFEQKDIEQVRLCAGTCDEQGKPDGCINSKFDQIEGGIRKNTKLEDEIVAQRADGVFALPTVIINNKHYRGGYSCPHPPTLGSCGVLNSVCQAYTDGTEPEACSPGYCWGEKDDCGECHIDGKESKFWNTKCDARNAAKSSEPTNPGVVAGIVSTIVVLVIVIVVVVVVMFVVLKKKDENTRRYVDSVVSSYLPMQDDGEETETAGLAQNAASTATL